MFPFSRVVILYIYFIPENTVSPVLGGRYSPHATAFTRTRLSRLEAGEEEENKKKMFFPYK